MHLDFCFCLEIYLSLSVYSERVEIHGHVEFGVPQAFRNPASPDRHALNLKSCVLEYAVPGSYIDFPLEVPYPDSGGHVVEIYVLRVKFDLFRQFNDVYREQRLLNQVKFPGLVSSAVNNRNAGIADSVIRENETYSFPLRALGGFVLVLEFLEIPYPASVLCEKNPETSYLRVGQIELLSRNH